MPAFKITLAKFLQEGFSAIKVIMARGQRPCFFVSKPISYTHNCFRIVFFSLVDKQAGSSFAELVFFEESFSPKPVKFPDCLEHMFYA